MSTVIAVAGETSQPSSLYNIVSSGESIEVVDATGTKRGVWAAPRGLPKLERMLAQRPSEWETVLQDVLAFVGAPVRLQFPFDHSLRELFLVGRRREMLTYSLHFSAIPQRLGAIDYAVISAADELDFACAETEAAFQKVFVGSYRKSGLQIGTDAPRAVSPALNAPANSGREKRILVVAYFAGRCSTVGAKRVNYWFEELRSLSGERYEIHLASAMPYEGAGDNHHYVPNFDIAEMFGSTDLTEWQNAFVGTEQRQRRIFSTQSYYWRVALERYFTEVATEFDIVLISGNPFAVFDFANFAKRRWGARVVLDYRDPFANNPRMAYSDESRAIARYIERGYNYSADLISVVNERCVPMVNASPEVPIAVIANGYDERQIPPASPRFRSVDGKVHFVHAGSIFHDRSPKALVRSLSAAEHHLHHAGNPSGFEDFAEVSTLSLHGALEYSEALKIVSSADCGIVFVSESGFETPTKLYDYLAYGLDILIITHGDVGTGAAADVLVDLSGVYWTRNTEEEISQFLARYRPGVRRTESEAEKFSRRASAIELLRALDEIV